MESKLEEGSKAWWEKKYESSSSFLFGKEPSPFLVENLSLLKKGEALDAGMGEGRNSVYLASKGFSVCGIDFVSRAVERAQSLAKDSGVSMDARMIDLTFFMMPLMKYQTILVCDFRPPLTLFKSLVRGLAKDGTILLEGYTTDQLKLNQGYKPEPFECFRANEALQHLRDLHIIFYNERRLSEKSSRVQLIARKVM